MKNSQIKIDPETGQPTCTVIGSLVHTKTVLAAKIELIDQITSDKTCPLTLVARNRLDGLRRHYQFFLDYERQGQ